MLGDYKVTRCSRQCFAEQRPLKEGEWYYSVVMHAAPDSGHDFERRDYSADAWTQPPEGAIAHWKCRMPMEGEKKLVLAPRAVLVDLLRQMEAVPDQAKTRYLLALMLLRRRFVRQIDSRSGAEIDAIEPKLQLHLEVVEDGTTIDVEECAITRDEAQTLSASLNEMLYCEASEFEQG